MDVKQNNEIGNRKAVNTLVFLEQIIFNLEIDKINESVESSLVYYDETYPYSYIFSICRIIYSYFISKGQSDICFQYLKQLESKVNDIFNNSYKIIDTFAHFIFLVNSQESNYLIEKMIENDLLDPKNYISNKSTCYFAHMTNEIYPNAQFSQYFLQNIDELSKNDFELHKKYVKEGVNPNEISKIIRNDEIEKLQEISSQSNFDFNQTIEPSLYERYSFVNQENVPLIDYAAFFGSVKCFKYLLMNNEKVNNTIKYAIAGGNEEIIHLCEHNHALFEWSYEIAIIFHRNDVFKYIYENKLDTIKNMEKLGKFCILYDNYEIFSFLLDNGMKIDEYLIYKAIKNGNLFLLQYLLEKNPISINLYKTSPTYVNKELFLYLIKNGYINIKEKNRVGKNAIIYASENGYTELFKLFLEQDVFDINDKDNNGWAALMYASINGHLEIIKLLIEQKGIDINTKDRYGGTALMKASYGGYIEIVKLLLAQKGIDFNAKDNDGETALIYASSRGHTEIVKSLLEKEGIDVNVKASIGNTVLITSSREGYIDIVKLLLMQKDIDINVKNNYRDTALIEASNKGYTDIVKLLLIRKEIDVNSINRWGETALILAAKKGYKDIIELLVKHEGIIINASDNLGNTALMYASLKGNIEIVKTLIEQPGIDINHKNNNGITALLYATKQDHKEIVQLLQQ